MGSGDAQTLLASFREGSLPLSTAADAAPRNVVLFVADGLRPGVVNEKTAPALTALMG